MHIPVIVPAAGLGTRLLPATRSLPKELLPVGRRALLDWIGLEALSAGAERLVLVTSPGKRDLFERHIGAPARAGHREDEEVAALWSRLPVEYVIQDEANGLGAAVRLGRDHLRDRIGRRPVGIMLPDEIHAGSRTLQRLVETAGRLGGSAIAAAEVAPSEVSRYGMIATDDVDDGSSHWETRVADLVEKPTLAETPSLLASVGRYLLDDGVLSKLDEIEPGAGGELQLADAIALAALRGDRITAVRIDCLRLDLGTWDGYNAAVSTLA
jgi:UTP--glucose-1-phosphate uridylyltransferase